MGLRVRSPNKSRWISLTPLVPASLAGWWPILSWWKCGYSHPLCSNVWFLIPDFSFQPVDHGAQEGWRLWNLSSQEGQRNSETRGGVSRLSKEEEQTGTQSRWALGVRLDSSSGVFWFNTPIFQVVTLRSREGKRLAHVIQDILGTELWTLPPRFNNFPALS